MCDQGSRAGDPLGDVCFVFLMCRVLRECRQRMGVSGLVGLNYMWLQGLDTIVGSYADLCSADKQVVIDIVMRMTVLFHLLRRSQMT